MAMKQRDGFTLLSVMVAMVLLSIGVMALAKTQFMVAAVTNQQSQKEQALQLASAYLEEVRSRDPWGLATEALATIDSTGAVNSAGKFTRAMTVADVGSQLESIQLTVTPKFGVHTRSVVINTFIFKVAR
jgi:type IV pilus assembly protein PilV